MLQPYSDIQLLLTRQQRREEALRALEEAARLGPDDPRYAYGYSLALHDAGRSREALSRLAAALDGHPNDRDLLYALATLHRDLGEPDRGLPYARRLVELAPEDPTFRSLVTELGGSAG